MSERFRGSARAFSKCAQRANDHGCAQYDRLDPMLGFSGSLGQT